MDLSVAMVADSAEVLNGKLYIMGGGWSNLTVTRPASFAVVLMIRIPRESPPSELSLAVTLLDANDEPVEVEGKPVGAGGKALLLPPTDGGDARAPFELPVAWNFVGVTMPQGTYHFRVDINDEHATDIFFDVINPSVPAEGGGS